MPLLRIQHYPGIKQVFIAAEYIADLATVELVTTGSGRRVALGTTGHEQLAAGVARGEVSSGGIVYVITDGIVSGVKAIQDINAGNRLTIATSGRVTSLNDITPTGAISGYVPAPTINLISGGGASGGIVVDSALAGTSGALTGVTGVQAPQFGSGSFVGAAFNTGRVIGKALTSGLSGFGIQMLVNLAG